jgi:hypothetical protein
VARRGVEIVKSGAKIGEITHFSADKSSPTP